MYERFAKLLDENGVTAYRVSKETGIATATLSDWKNGRSVPKQDKLLKIAEYFDVSLDYLLGKSDIRNPYKEAPEEEEDNIDLWLSKTDGYKELPEEDREKIMEYVKFMLEKHKKPESK